MTATLTYAFTATLVESIDLGLDHPDAIKLDWTLPSASGKLNAGSTPPLVTGWSDEISMAGATHVIDTTALGRGGASGLPDLDPVGESVCFIAIEADSANPLAVTVTEAPATAYPLFGTTFSFELEPGDRLMALKNGMPVLAAATNDDLLELNGAASDVVRILVGFGS